MRPTPAATPTAAVGATPPPRATDDVIEPAELPATHAPNPLKLQPVPTTSAAATNDQTRIWLAGQCKLSAARISAGGERGAAEVWRRYDMGVRQASSRR